MHSVSFGCWTPKLRVIVYDNFNQDVYKKWLCFIKRYDLKAKRARNVKVISMGWTKQDGIRMYRRLKRTFKRPKKTRSGEDTAEIQALRHKNRIPASSLKKKKKTHKKIH
ncbi:hypothetical protein ONI91_21395, partial [Salmonella enterica subsp. enterica serovar Montevideo]|nr:hypothetical protein [Salmonella enterica subsp. enterica serovar Montevideo]